MELPGLTHIGMDRCQNLNWKGQFIEATYNCLGPDGKVADEYECNAARECYKAL